MEYFFMRKKLFYSFLIFLFFATQGYSKELCSDENATLDCLSKNFDKLYHSNYKLFSDILHKAEKKVQQCSSISDVVKFMELIRIPSINAEFNEFFDETIENLCFDNSKCFFEAIIRLKKEDQIKIIDIVKTPIFVHSAGIKNVFNSYKDNKGYKDVTELYFNGTKKK
jgi:hypothetical protein